MKRVLVLVPILLLAGIAAPALADPRGIAMGGTDAAIARGADAVRWNPALLGLRGSPGFSMRLFQAGARADNHRKRAVSAAEAGHTNQVLRSNNR